MKHSPAPWRWETVEGYGSSWLYDSDGNQIWHSITTPSQPDAALVAAAPDLLEALRFAYKQIYDGYDNTVGDESEALDYIQSVIAKAEGNVLYQNATE